MAREVWVVETRHAKDDITDWMPVELFKGRRDRAEDFAERIRSPQHHARVVRYVPAEPS